MAVLDLKKNAALLFTAVFYAIRKALRCGKRFILIYGGSGSSKSYSLHQSELINLMRSKTDTLIMRKVGSDIYDSSYKLLESIATKWGIYDWFEWTYSQGKRQILYKKTGRRITFRGADDIGKLKSIAGIGRIILEEADQFEFDDFKEINRRVRGVQNIQIVFVFNPVDEQHWLKKYFFDPKGTDKMDPRSGVYHDRTEILKFTYHQNNFLTQDDIDELEAMKDVDEYDYDVYVLANWGRIKTGAEFYPHWSDLAHVTDVPVLYHLPFHITYDFNVVPYMTLLVMQYNETPTQIQLRFTREYCLSSPLNSVDAVTESFVDDFEKWLQTIFYYGDASGNNRIAGKGDEVNYDDVRRILARWLDDDVSDRTARSNKQVMKRRKFINKLLAGKFYYGGKQVVFMVDHSCVNTIADFKYLKLGKDGKLKQEVKDPKTGQKYQKYGHCTDASEYLVCELFDDVF